jgi:hypothetical protein
VAEACKFTAKKTQPPHDCGHRSEPFTVCIANEYSRARSTVRHRCGLMIVVFFRDAVIDCRILTLYVYLIFFFFGDFTHKLEKK